MSEKKGYYDGVESIEDVGASLIGVIEKSKALPKLVVGPQTEQELRDYLGDGLVDYGLSARLVFRQYDLGAELGIPYPRN